MSGYPVMFVLAIGLIARSAIGPVERLLNMLGHQNVCALAYGLAFLLNLALCILLVPKFGLYGAAASTSIALVAESIILFLITRRRLGFHVFAFGKSERRRGRRRQHSFCLRIICSESRFPLFGFMLSRIYAAVQPPSIDRFAPVIWLASSPHRYSANAAT